MKNVTLKQLRVLAAVAREGSMAAAARVLCVTPPAVTLQIQQLEEQAGLTLLERMGEKITLTQAGEIVLKATQRTQSALLECEEELALLKGISSGRVSVGVVSTAKYFVPKALSGFRQRYGGIDVRLLVANRGDTIAALMGLDVDMAIMGRPPQVNDMVCEVLGDHPHIIIAEAGHPLANKKLSLADLAGQTFFIREQDSGTRMLMERLFEEAGFRPNVGMEISSNETIKQAVIAGLGIAFISAHTVGAELADGRLVALAVKGLPAVRQWFVVRLKDKAIMPAAKAMWSFLLTEGRRFLPTLQMPAAKK